MPGREPVGHEAADGGGGGGQGGSGGVCTSAAADYGGSGGGWRGCEQRVAAFAGEGDFLLALRDGDLGRETRERRGADGFGCGAVLDRAARRAREVLRVVGGAVGEGASGDGGEIQRGAEAEGGFGDEGGDDLADGSYLHRSRVGGWVDDGEGADGWGRRGESCGFCCSFGCYRGCGLGCGGCECSCRCDYVDGRVSGCFSEPPRDDRGFSSRGIRRRFNGRDIVDLVRQLLMRCERVWELGNE